MSARGGGGVAEAALLLGEYRKMRPHPVEEMIFFDHPSGYTRILTAMRWKAEHTAARDVDPFMSSRSPFHEYQPPAFLRP